MHTANLLIISDPENGLYAPLSLLLSRSAPPGVTLYHPRPAVHLSGGVYSWYWTLHIDCLQMLHIMNIRPEHISELEAILNAWMWQVGLLISDWIVTKIDYSYNVCIDDSKVCDALFDALQHCPQQADYLIRRAKYETSIYAKSKSLKRKSRAFQIYDKEAERRARGIVPADYETDVIRMEHQVRSNHLKAQRRDKGVHRTWESWMNWDRRTEYLQRGFKFVQSGDFYSLSAARDLIYSNNGYRADVQKKLDKYISIISNGGMDALKKVRGFTSHNTRNDYNQKLARIGVNPLTLDAQYGIDHIPMPFDLS